MRLDSGESVLLSTIKLEHTDPQFLDGICDCRPGI